MGLFDQIEEMKKELDIIDPDKLVDDEDELIEEEAAAEEEPEPADATEEEKQKQEADPKPKTDTKADEEEAPQEKPNNAAFARIRRELAAAKRELAAAKEAPQQQQVPPQPVQSKENDPEPQDQNSIEWLKWDSRKTKRELAELRESTSEVTKVTKEQQLENAAFQELAQYEENFKATVDDFDAVSQHFNNTLAAGIQIVNPGISRTELAKLVKAKALEIAANFHVQGLDPVEEMYHLTKEKYGYKEPEPAKNDEEEEKPEESKPNLRKIAANKSRNAGTAAARGSSVSPTLTKDVLSTMSVAEYAKIPASERKRILSGK